LIVCTIENERGERFQIGETAAGNNLILRLCGKTNEEIGAFTEIKIVAGQWGGKETVLHNFNTEKMDFEASFDMAMTPFTYIRCEAATSQKMFCYTNPIWIKTI
jgi:hypothetical protein